MLKNKQLTVIALTLLSLCVVMFAGCTLEGDIDTVREKASEKNSNNPGNNNGNPFNGTTWSYYGESILVLSFTDSTWTIVQDGYSIYGSYTRNGNTATLRMYEDGYDMEFAEVTISGNNLTLRIEGGTITFTKNSGSSGTTYTVTFDANDATSGTAPEPRTVNYGSSIELPLGTGLSKTGYTFGGWNTDPSGTGINYDAGFSYPVTDNIILYAKWDSVATQQFTVTFDTNEGSGTVDPPTLTVDAGSYITLPNGNGLSRTGYTFGGWNTNASGTGINYDADSSYPDPVTDNIILYAKWDASGPIDPVDVPGTNLAAKLSWLASNAQSDGEYIIEVNTTEGLGPSTLSYRGKSNITITIKGIGSECTVSLSSNDAMFTVGSGVTLVLDDNITLQGRSSNTRALVLIDSNGTLIMNTGSKITGNANTSSSYYGSSYNYMGGGVYVSKGGTFTMNGGTISGNTARYGGGVFVYGTFTMSGGTISGNTATASSYAYGGGVFVSGTFTMSGGTISGNTARDSGGGVYMEGQGGTFTMSGGTISGNTASTSGGGVCVNGSGTSFTMSGGTISDNTARDYGGGVYIYKANFTKTGGTITGYDSDTINGNVVKNSSDTVRINRGHAIYGYFSDSNIKRKETTAGPEVNLTFNGSGSSLSWSGDDWDY